jgi:class 3 adenylate cyclase/streptogramin lyase
VPGTAPRRRLATVLFVDIVGSTALASELGDARWHSLLSRFRRVVRAELKRYGGREQDTAGDGFFATFAEPAQALRAAAAIVAAVQHIGVDIRGGVHTGECELIDGKLGGIAVHIASRVIALAGPAEVLATGTVRDLVSGSGAGFEDRGVHELKGVEGSWQVVSLRSIETNLPEPLTAEEAASRLALLAPPERRRRLQLAIAAGVAAVAAAAVAVSLLAFGGGNGKAGAPIDLVRLDGRTGRIAAVTGDAVASKGHWANLWSVDGTLWQLVGNQHARLIERNIQSGRVVHTLPLGQDACSCRVAFGFGSVWLLRSGVIDSGKFAGQLRPSIARFDELSGRRLETIVLSGDVESGTIATGNGAVWVLESGGTLLRVDPVSNHVTGTYETGAVETQTLVPLAGYEWICECMFNRVRRFDPRTRQARTFRIAAQAYLIGVDASRGRTLWLLDPQNATLTSMDPSTGRTEAPLGLSGNPQQAVIAFGAVWAAAGRVVDRLDLRTRQKRTIAMPAGVWAGSIAADTATGSIWIGNSGSAPGGPRAVPQRRGSPQG